MDQSIFVLNIILIILIADYLIEQILDYLNFKSLKPNMPSILESFFPQDKYQKSIEYNKAKERFGFISGSFSFALTVVVISIGFLGYVNDYLLQYTDSTILHALLFFGVIFIGSDILNIPFSYYNTFVIEQKFGFNKATKKLFFMDKIKGYFLMAILGGGILSILLLLIESIGPNFWWWFWIVISILMIGLNMLYTSVIVPLFNKLTPLEDGELRTAIEDYAKSVNFPLTNVFVIDGSKRSSKSNAYFSGFGKSKKVVLFDTLIENHTIEELVGVLAHEIGHFKKKHIIQGMVLSVLQVGIMLFILGQILFHPELSLWLSQALGAAEVSIPLNMIAFGILYTPISKITGILMNVFSRKNEFEADEYAATTYKKEAIADALKKLSADNLSHMTPHGAYVFVHYSHPPVIQRLQAIEKIG